MCDSATPWTAAYQASLSITSSQSLHKLMSIELVISSNHLILCHPLLLLPSIFPSIRGFSNESALSMRWPKYWSFTFNISPSNEYSGLISFRMDWLDLLAVQGTLKRMHRWLVANWELGPMSSLFLIYYLLCVSSWRFTARAVIRTRPSQEPLVTSANTGAGNSSQSTCSWLQHWFPALLLWFAWTVSKNLDLTAYSG